ncbi:hypothetical protein P171DRAFT_480294 [Karstenula rhodostoma CBS 690.94]|uniref:Uncharacterized protein n=1 Tax=Karstenula rhodostoma CBS 690.94 TaxID=1392251 RepID=A0A9P4PTR4_9PLEO|nr:hypothetical protein P171DRAFT_480294 [Karstenula rhodostoma CBS 690.94]
MPSLFRPPANPLATRADTWPYIYNICGHLTLGSASVYRNFIKLFEDGVVAEETLSSMIRDSHIFDNNLDASLLHDDLVIVILLNKVDASNQATAAAEPARCTVAPPQPSSRSEHRSPPALLAQVEYGKADVEYEKGHEVATDVESRFNHESQLSPEPSSTRVETPVITSISGATVNRVRNPVGSWEKKTLAQEAEKFLTTGKRSTRQNGSSLGMGGSRRKSSQGVDYNKQSD